jgi:hypothetical protein
MKNRSPIITVLLLCHLSLFATTPYDLEGIKALNVLVLDQNDILSSQEEQKLLQTLKERLEAEGISSQKDGVGAMFVKLSAVKIKGVNVVHITLAVGEEAVVRRGSSSVETFVLSYSYEDMIETKRVEADVYDTVIDYLFDEFMEQYEEDNDV